MKRCALCRRLESAVKKLLEDKITNSLNSNWGGRRWRRHVLIQFTIKCSSFNKDHGDTSSHMGEQLNHAGLSSILRTLSRGN